MCRCNNVDVKSLTMDQNKLVKINHGNLCIYYPILRLILLIIAKLHYFIINITSY